jgi:dimethylaniline monooxygenase (N-oxide forming)
MQPVGAVMPLVEAQCGWIVEMLTGRYAAPPAHEVRRQMLVDHQRNKRRFYASVRHTMEVDFDHYLWDLARERRRGARRAREGAPVPFQSLAGAGQ